MRTWADDFNTYDEACAYYGADTPTSLACEAAYYEALEAEETARMEMVFGPYVRFTPQLAEEALLDFPF